MLLSGGAGWNPAAGWQPAWSAGCQPARSLTSCPTEEHIFRVAYSVGPTPQTGADRVPGADRRKQHDIAFLETPLRDGIACCQGQGTGRGIAVAFDVDH